MESFDFDFKIEGEYERAWLYYTGAMAVSMILTISTYFTTEFKYYSDVDLAYFISSCISEDSVLVLPLISFLFLLRNLCKRFVGLNSLLRFPFSY